MSPCPKCGKKAVHYGIVVPWETLERPDVLHKCACGLLFIEPAKDAPAMFAKVEWWIQGFDPEAIQDAPNAPEDSHVWVPGIEGKDGA